jgi:hypothetical protein
MHIDDHKINKNYNSHEAVQKLREIHFASHVRNKAASMRGGTQP